MLDELPFGLYAEIEGDEEAIIKAEHLLELTNVEAESATYPELANKFGVRNGDRVEARFEKKRGEDH